MPTALAWLVAAFGCGPADPSPGLVDEGQLLVDSAVVIDRFHFSRAACDELMAGGPADAGSLPAGSVTRLAVTAIACWSATVKVEDSTGKAVVAFTRRFDIPGRKDGDKERGELGYLAWDGKDAAGNAVPPGAYLWRIDFFFGSERSIRFRADMRID